MNFHEFGLGIGWCKVFSNVCLLITLVFYGVKILVSVIKSIDS